MITRTTKYTASDGTEHDSPQAAAQKDLEATLLPIVEKSCPAGWIEGVSSFDLHAIMREVAEALAQNPEALHDAVNAYFEDLEEYPDVDHHQRAREIVDGWPDWKRGYRITEHSPELGNVTVSPPVRRGNPDDPTTWRADLPVDHPNYCRPFGTREN